MSGYHALALLSVVAVLALLLVPTVDAVKDTEGDEPWDRYPYADFIITVDKDGSTVVNYQAPVTPDDESSAMEWRSTKYAAGSDISVVNWSDVEPPDLEIVYEGADVGDLSLIRIDDATLSMKYVNITFYMVSGTIDTLSLVTVPYSQQSKLGNSYIDAMFNPIVDAEVHLLGGRVTEFNPTASMVHIESMKVNVGTGMTVDRLLTTGDNGRYGQVDINLLGGTVGYMANLKSRIGSLSYNMEYGTVRYFCIGADTEAGGNQNLSSACTSYVTGDVDVRIGDKVSIGYAIIGGGMVNNPNILCNGEKVQDTPARNISIEANGKEVHADTCFMNEKRTHSYQFGSYKVEGSPSTRQVSTTCSLSNGSTIPVYGPEGIWSGNSNLIIPQGTSMFVNCILYVSSGGVIDIELGGRLVITDSLIMYGVVNAVGELINSSVIELRDNGELSGTVSGGGYIADYIVSQTTGSSINIMSSFDTVVISQLNSHYVQEITALLLSGECSVSISVQYSGMAFGSDRFMISLKELVSNDDFAGAYNLYIEGVDPSLLEICMVDVTIPIAVPVGYDAKVYHYTGSDDSVEVECDVSQYGQITFHTNIIGDYGITFVKSDDPVVPHKRETNMIEVVILLTGIVVVLILMAYTVTRFREKP